MSAFWTEQWSGRCHGSFLTQGRLCNLRAVVFWYARRNERPQGGRELPCLWDSRNRDPWILRVHHRVQARDLWRVLEVPGMFYRGLPQVQSCLGWWQSDTRFSSSNDSNGAAYLDVSGYRPVGKVIEFMGSAPLKLDALVLSCSFYLWNGIQEPSGTYNMYIRCVTKHDVDWCRWCDFRFWNNHRWWTWLREQSCCAAAFFSQVCVLCSSTH